MSNRFYVNQPLDGDLCQITGETAHHVLNVMRMQIGDSLTLFNGTNYEFHATITETAKKAVTVTIQSSKKVSRELAIRITVATAFPKGDRQKFMIEKLVELGVERLIPLRTERSVVNLQEKSQEKIQRWIVEASKQCGRNRLMTIQPTVSFNDWIQTETTGTRLIAHPDQSLLSITDVMTDSIDAGLTHLTIGPEGGFSDSEIARATQAGWVSFAIGNRILRIETAAIALASIFSLAHDTAPPIHKPLAD